MKGTRKWEAEEVRLGKSSWGMKGIKRWVAKVDSAPLISLEKSELLRKALILMSPNLELGITDSSVEPTTELPNAYFVC